MTPTPPPRRRHLLQHIGFKDTSRTPAALSTMALMFWMIWNGLGGCLAHCIKSCVVSNDRNDDHNRMGYIVEPFHVPHRMLPHLVLLDWITILLLAKDMDNKFHEGHNHILWRKLCNLRRRSGNGLNISILPQNPLRQVTTHPGFTDHDPFGVPSYVLKRR